MSHFEANVFDPSALTVYLVVLDPPAGKGRPRADFTRGRVYTPAATKHAESAVRAAWIAAGRPTFPPDTPLIVTLDLYLARGAGHRLSNGGLSAAGRRAGERPRKKPDVDNAAKLVLDALEKYAYPSDAAIVELDVGKHWCAPGDDGPRTEITITVAHP